jgi:hypothetical protein
MIHLIKGLKDSYRIRAILNPTNQGSDKINLQIKRIIVAIK